MKPMTMQNMRDAFGGECAAHMRYIIFSERAELEGFTNMARMLRAIAFAEAVHASSHYRQTREMLGDFPVRFTAPFIYERTVDNLKKSYEAEISESKHMYPAFAAVAKEENDKRAQQNFEWAAEVEKGHAEMIERVLGYTEKTASEPVLGDIYVCDICGYIVEGGPPESCPICKAKHMRFKLIG